MEKSVFEKWEAEAYALENPPERLPYPAEVLAGEAVDVAYFAKRHWEEEVDSRGNPVRPGLKVAVGNGTFTEGIADEILELHLAFQIAVVRHRMIIQDSGAAPIEEAQFMLSDLRATLQWHM